MSFMQYPSYFLQVLSSCKSYPYSHLEHVVVVARSAMSNAVLSLTLYSVQLLIWVFGVAEHVSPSISFELAHMNLLVDAVSNSDSFKVSMQK